MTKIFTVASLFFLPPTMIASIYSMSFVGIQELHWKYGYPFALGLMVLASRADHICSSAGKNGWQPESPLRAAMPRSRRNDNRHERKFLSLLLALCASRRSAQGTPLPVR